MEEKPNLDMVILAVSTLYKNPDKKEKDKASEWLLHLQNSVSIKKIYFHTKFILLNIYVEKYTSGYISYLNW